jgi:hypothetical protein
MLEHWLRPVVGFGLAACTLAGCGDDSDTPEARSAPPPIVADAEDEQLSLEAGTYYVEGIRDVQDGCGKFDDAGGDALTQVPFNLTNDGDGVIGIDFCSYDGKSLSGTIRGGRGTLAVIHHSKRVGNDEVAAVFDQECRIDVEMKEDNVFEGRYVENQRNRNEAMRAATVDRSECSTGFSFTMKKRG